MSDQVNALAQSDEDFANTMPDLSGYEMPSFTNELPEPSDDDEHTDPVQGDEHEEGQEVDPPQDEPEASQEDFDEQEGEGEEDEEKAPTEAPELPEGLDRIFAPFKANGREIKVDSVDEVISLMQMGMNYNKKMAGLKPSLKVLKTLEANGLLDEEKINFLIDLDKRNPNAIGKLLADSEYDAYSQNEDEVKDYKPTQHAITDSELAINMVIEDIKDTPNFAKTAEFVSKELDAESKAEIERNPGILRDLNEHTNNGMFDIIARELERERILGRTTGVPVLVAYQQVGQRLHEAGAFNEILGITASQPANTVVTPVNAAKQAAERQKKRAVTPPKSVSTASNKDDFNPLALSDEEFEKQFNEQLNGNYL